MDEIAPSPLFQSPICVTASFRHRSFAAMAGGMSSLAKTPAQLGYRMPAEWEPHVVTWLSWPRREGISFPGSFDRVLPVLRAMVEALLTSEIVNINVCNGAHEAEARVVLDPLDSTRLSFHLIP